MAFIHTEKIGKEGEGRCFISLLYMFILYTMSVEELVKKTLGQGWKNDGRPHVCSGRYEVICFSACSN